MTAAELKKRIATAEAKAEFADELTGEVAKLAWRDKLRYKEKVSLLKTLIVCLTVALCVALGFAVHAVKYAVDKNYEYLESLILETETVTEVWEEVTQDADNGGTNNYIGRDGDINNGKADDSTKN